MTSIIQRPLTEFARKYGRYNANDYRSALTPDEAAFPYIGTSPYNEWDARGYQRARLFGFTTEELSRLDCLPTRELKPGNLQNGIVPLLRRERWEYTPRRPDLDRDYMYTYMVAGTYEFWWAGNDVVWAALEPALLLASRIIMSTHLMPWVCDFQMSRFLLQPLKTSAVHRPRSRSVVNPASITI